MVQYRHGCRYEEEVGVDCSHTFDTYVCQLAVLQEECECLTVSRARYYYDDR